MLLNNVHLSVKKISFWLIVSVLITSCGSGQQIDDNGVSGDLSLGELPTASVSELDAPIVDSQNLAFSPSSNQALVTTDLELAAATTSNTQSTVQEQSVSTELDVVENLNSENVTDIASEQSGEAQQSSNVVESLAQINETFAETEQVDTADSVSLTGCVGNLVWADSNGDGVKSTNERGIAVEKIELVSEAGNVVDSTSTASGYYQLCAVPGVYTIRVDFATDYRVTQKDVGNSDTADSDANEFGEIIAEVVASKNKTKYDIGLIELSGLTQQVTDTNVVTSQSVESAPEIQEVTPVSQVEESTPDIQPTLTSESTAVDAMPEVATSQPTVTPLASQNQTSNTNPVNNNQLRWGFWTETRNSYQSSPGSVDEGVESTFENYSFAHVKAMSLQSVGGDTSKPDYVVNVLDAAERTSTSLDIQLGSSGEYGWNFSTGRGNFNLSKWKDSISKFSASVDPAAHSSIVNAIQNGTIRYIFLIDEPNHKRWSPSWDGSHGASAPGNANHVSNEDLDEMAAHVKSVFGNNVKTIVRTSPVNLTVGARGGAYVFRHMTHAYLTISSTKWTAGGNKGPNKGLEWYLTLKNNHADNTTNMTAFRATNLEPSIMIQAGFQSVGNPWTGENNFKSQWWQGNIRYPFNGATGYVKTAPGEMDYWIKSLLSPRDPETGVLSDSGIRWFNEFVIFRADRLPTDSGRLPFSTYPHYRAFLDQLRVDMNENNLNPIVGIPVGWTGN